MGGCNSCCRFKRGSVAETVPYSKDNPLQDPKNTLSEVSTSPPAKNHKALSSTEIPEDKRVVVHESKEVLLKENQKNLSLLRPPSREFSGKPKNVDFGKRPEKCQSKPRTENVAFLRTSTPSRRLDSPEPRIPVRKIPVKKQSFGESRLPVRRQQNSEELEKIPVRRSNSGDLRSSSPTARVAKGSRRIVKEGTGSDSLRMNSSRRMHLRKEGSAARREVKTEDFEEKNKCSGSSESEKLVVEVAEKPRNLCEAGSVSSVALPEAEGDLAMPPIDLENPLISLDCFIFL